MDIVFRSSLGCFSEWFKPLPLTEAAQLDSEHSEILDQVWPQVEACNCPLNRKQIASGISLIGRIQPGRYSKKEVSKMTKGVLERSIVISEVGELYIIPQKKGKLLGKGAAKRVYEGYRITLNGVEPIAYLTVKRGIEAAEKENQLALHINSPYVMGQSMTEFRYEGRSTKYEKCGTKKVKANKLFIAQKKMDGTVKDLLNSNNFSKRERLEALISVATGLRDMHASGVTHNDLHYENIFYRRENGKLEVKIADLGCATKNMAIEYIQSDISDLRRCIVVFFKDTREDIKDPVEEKIESLVDSIDDRLYSNPSGLIQEVIDQLEELLSQVDESTL